MDVWVCGWMDGWRISLMSKAKVRKVFHHLEFLQIQSSNTTERIFLVFSHLPWPDALVKSWILPLGAAAQHLPPSILPFLPSRQFEQTFNLDPKGSRCTSGLKLPGFFFLFFLDNWLLSQWTKPVQFHLWSQSEHWDDQTFSHKKSIENKHDALKVLTPI